MSSITRFQFEQMQARLARPAGDASFLPPASPLEKELHRQIMAHCDAQWPRWKYIHSRMDQRPTQEAGVPDFVIVLPQGRTLYVEAKRPGEKLSPAQRDWQAEMAKLNHTVYVVHDLKEFLSVLSDLGQPLSNPPPI
jgi:adenosyl cobinamide kinase/adenosyl cobinamide phosphate guanylyltransferase